LIFVTVGTHEQGMDRLLVELDRLIEKKIITEELFAQIGYSEYKPKNYKYEDMIGYDEMDSYVRRARVVIVHGGPGSIFHPLKYGKIPVVVPRNPEFNEHVDNHQVLFTKRLDVNLRVIGVYDIRNLEEKINHYDQLALKCVSSKSNVNEFIRNFDMLISEKVKLGRIE